MLRYIVSEDCGVMINPAIVEGQIAGGVVQGIGGVLLEDFVYDEQGNPLTTTFLDYLLPTAADVPTIEYGHIETPASTPGDYKGVGEGGAIGAPAAVANAVNDAARARRRARCHRAVHPATHRRRTRGRRPLTSARALSDEQSLADDGAVGRRERGLRRGRHGGRQEADHAVDEVRDLERERKSRSSPRAGALPVRRGVHRHLHELGEPARAQWLLEVDEARPHVLLVLALACSEPLRQVLERLSPCCEIDATKLR